MKVRVHVDIEEAVIQRIQELTRGPVKDFIEYQLNNNFDLIIQYLLNSK